MKLIDNIVNPRIPNAQEVITITQYTELIDHKQVKVK